MSVLVVPNSVFVEEQSTSAQISHLKSKSASASTSDNVGAITASRMRPLLGRVTIRVFVALPLADGLKKLLLYRM